MNIDSNLLGLLADGRFHSGAALAENLAISRAAIWKKISRLRRAGIDIYAVKGKGYRLSQPLECLQTGLIDSAMPADARRRLQQLTILQDVDSTNAWLLARINQPAFHAHAVLAEQQTAGRGRHGNYWFSPFAAGICLSVGWRFPQPLPATSLISLATAVAVTEALQAVTIDNVGLKWPNDIYWQGRKLGGILVEMRMESAGPCHVVVGIGINYALPAAASALIDQPWVDIKSIKPQAPSRNRLAAELIASVITLLQQLPGRPAADIVAAWRKHDCMRGRRACLILPNRNLQGTVLGIDADGALLFSDGNQPQRYLSGEISLRGVA